ncbi:MAG: hypothetical protein KGZ83_00230 [Sulfuricella sp.]|nr:hypothetical protein [Sulfuricella sp.]
MQPKVRWTILLTLLTLSAGLVLFGDEPRSEKLNSIVDSTTSVAEKRGIDASNFKQSNGRSSPLQTNPTDKDQQEILAIRPRISDAETAEAFIARNWTLPPLSLPPPPPTAPPLPFSFLGKKFEDGIWEVFLGEQDNTYVVKEHDVLNQHYIIEAIHPPTMTITYTPLQQQQTLAIGDAQ